MDESPERALYIAPLPLAEWDQDVFDAFEPMRPPADSVFAQRKDDRKKGGARTAAAFGPMARHPALTKAWHQFNRHILYFSTLSERERELVVLRVAALRRSEYEWAQHVPVAVSVGISPEAIERIGRTARIGPSGSPGPDAAPDAAPDAGGWTEHDVAVLRAVDELHHDGVMSAGTWRQLATRLDDRQLMDLVFTAGAYDTLALAFNCFGLQPDPEIAHNRLPPIDGRG